MALTALEYKTKGNEYYSKNEFLLSIESYTKAIEIIENTPDEENLSLYVLYLNRSAAYIKDKNFYSAYHDAKKSLKLKTNENNKGYYRAALCAYHLGFIEKSKEFLKERTKNNQENLSDYLALKLSIEKKVQCMIKWRKPVATAKKTLKNLEHIIQKRILLFEMPSMLYQIRYLLRSYFEKTKDRKLLNIDHGDLGLRLHELAIEFNTMYPIEKFIQTDPIFEDLILNEMPDVGSLRLQASKQQKLPRDQRDYDLEDKAQEDLTAYEFSFFINNILASLVVNSTDKHISLRALKQLHRLTTIDLYRCALGDALSDAINTYIYSNSKTMSIVEYFLTNSGIEILFHDYVEAACQLSASRFIKQITIGHWKKQTLSTIQFVIRQISKKIRREGSDLIEPKALSPFLLQLKKMMTNSHLNHSQNNDDDEKEEKRDFNLIINVLTKIYFVFGQKPFIEHSLCDPLFLYVKQVWFPLINDQKHQCDITFLIHGWSDILTKWFKLDYKIREKFIEQINPDHLYCFDDD